MRLLAIILAAAWILGVTLFMPGGDRTRSVSEQLSNTATPTFQVH